MNTISSFIGVNSYSVSNNSGYLEYVTEVGTCDAAFVQKFISHEYVNKGITSLNELFSGYKTGDSGNLTKAEFTERTTTVSGKSVSQNGGYLDVRFDMVSYDVRSGLNTGMSPTFGTNYPSDMTEVINKKDLDDIRGVSFRTPMMMTGFGYTTEGMPFPSKYDYNKLETEHYLEYEDTSGWISLEGPIRSSGEVSDYDEYSGAYYTAQNSLRDDKRSFYEHARVRPDLHKAGPVDLRWDTRKSMWVSAPEVYCGYSLSNVSPASGRYASQTFTSGYMEVSTGAYSNYGVCDKDEILFINRSVSLEITRGMFMIVTRTNNGEYIPTWVDCDVDSSGGV